MARSKPIRRKRTKKKKSALGFLPESVQAFVARRLLDSIALLVTGTGLFTAIALATYSKSDPSLNAAANAGQTQNWMGAWGAGFADFGLQTIGLGAALISIAFLSWGLRLFRRQPIRPLFLRVPALLFAALMASVPLAFIEAGSWFATDTIGGAFGTIIQNKLLGFDFPYNNIAIIGLFSFLSLGTFLFAAAVTWSEILYVLAWCKAITLGLIGLTIRGIVGFKNWVAHYNDPDYVPQRILPEWDIKSLLPERMPKAEITLPKKAPVVEDDYIEPEAVKEDNRSFAQKRTVFDKDSKNIPIKTTKQSDAAKKSLSGQQRFALSDTGEWELPPLNLIQTPPPASQQGQLDEKALQRNAELLQNVLADYGVEGEITSIHPGPVVTLYELEPAPGTKSAKIISLSDDIARSMAAVSVRCAVVPGRSVIGIELPNKNRQIVYMQELLGSTESEKSKAGLPLILGKDISGGPIIADLAKMPHLLVAGTTGSGKSVAVNTMILSLLYRLPPEKCRFIMIDPKMLELSVYDDIPHLLTPVVTEPGKAVVALKWAVNEMEERYRSMSKLGVRNIDGYNARIREAIKNNETIMNKVQTGFDLETGKPEYEDVEMELAELPYIVVIVDEFADLMLVAGKDVENAIQRLAQMARAAGIHLIMATQRPSVDVITGVIKANFPTRISFQVTSKIDSRTILGEGGAEQLLGMGDMLYMAPGGKITRVHGPFVSDDEVEKVVDFLKAQAEPSYLTDVTEGGDYDSEVMNAMFGETGGSSDVDELYDQAVAVVAREGKASTSFIQRHLQIGYNRAARIVEEMEKQGVISPASSTGKRTVLVTDHSSAA